MLLKSVIKLMHFSRKVTGI